MANNRWRTRLRILYKLPVNNLNDLTRKVVAIMALVSENKPLRWETGEHIKPSKPDRYVTVPITIDSDVPVVTLKGEYEDDSDEIQD